MRESLVSSFPETEKHGLSRHGEQKAWLRLEGEAAEGKSGQGEKEVWLVQEERVMKATWRSGCSGGGQKEQRLDQG
eukprot:scaffold64035_cov21-Tisochrysis_lutea.AAC.4